MKVFFVCVLLLVSATSLFSQTRTRPRSNQTADQLRKVVEQFSEAFAKADAATLERLLADDYIHTNASGSVLNKEQWLAYIKVRKTELESGKLTIDSYLNDDVSVRLHGNTAIVTGRNVAAGKRDGQSFVTRLRFTHLWVKRGKQWQRAAFHDSTLPQ